MPSTTGNHLVRWARLSVFVGLTCVGLPARESAAQPSSAKVAAESMFATGKSQLAAGDVAAACASFAESQRLDPSVGTLLNLGQCSEKLGRLATAWTAYREAASLASNRKEERGVTAANLARALEPRLAKLTITVKGATPGVLVTRDGVQISAFGVPFAVDAGEHVVEAAAPGYETFKVTVKIADGPKVESLEVPELVKLPEPPAKPDAPVDEVPPGNRGQSPRPPSAVGDAPGMSGVAIAGFVVGGVGAAGLIVGGALGLVASSTASSAEEDPTLCPGKRCSPAGRSEIDSAETQALISTIGFAAGGALLAGGVTMVAIGLATGADEGDHVGGYVLPWWQPAPGGASFGIAGSF